LKEGKRGKEKNKKLEKENTGGRGNN